ncbi:MAG: hypothetical protein COX36_04255 [Candidatus Nealsonbacteria bacterium CG23_combo_of_CG06-09_8_20_14_all_38_19]|uniref:Uncharacterized protein n=1 Tax=Candidatus Nealsonbacteria bacterium CG23_combo_of_CG06-09_8_20_14_all_38_19 TaxID=1974721 RepID=A0A2G9YVM6_9BACT|nr:MAG: hypothetical protein COX36_04255 [Candidatus Nealsonbacteria bacterium CG23_combo_of_CG06-09_8_20_14_all_38_19]
MDALVVVKRAIEEKVKSDVYLYRVARLNELWRMLKEASEIGLNVIVHVNTESRHWRIGLNVDKLLSVADLVSGKEADSWLIGESVSSGVCLYPTVYPMDWAAVCLLFMDDFLSPYANIRVEAEPHLQLA